MNKLLLALLVIIILILTAVSGYFIFQNQKLIKILGQASPSPFASQSPSIITGSPLSSPIISPSPTISKTSLEENIKDATNSGNTAALATFMTNPVSVIIQASECCGPKTPDEAVSQLSYINQGKPFDFNQNSPAITNIKAKNPELAGKFVGVSQFGEQLVAFGINTQSKISDIRMSISWKLFNY